MSLKNVAQLSVWVFFTLKKTVCRGIQKKTQTQGIKFAQSVMDREK